MDDARSFDKDVLYLACTRPTMKMGVPLEGLFANFLICYLAFIWIGHANLLSISGVASLLCLPVVHCAMRIMTTIDHNLFRVARLAIETRGMQIRGTSVLWAMDWRRPRTKKDLASSV
jgi:type IV secretory pathway VirB3-like protein